MIVKMPKIVSGAVLAIATALVFSAANAHANGEESSAASSTESTASSDLGTGTFSQLPFRVSASVRGGYDDKDRKSVV